MTKVANNSNAQGGKAQNRGVANRTIQQRRPKRPFQDKGVAALPAVDWTTVELKEFRKCFVDTTKTPAKKYTEANIAKFYVEAEARVQGPLVDGKPSTVDLKAPYSTLKETPFPAVLQSELTKQGIPKPVPLQSISWPYIMSGRNFVGVAPSGLDKIYTYVLPAVVHVADQLANAAKAAPAKPKPAPVETPAEGEEKVEGEKVEGEKVEGEKAEPENDNGPIAVILTNLKKRGEQIMEILKPYQTAMNVTSHLVWGGSEKKKEAEDPVVDGLKENPHILVVALGQKFSDLLTGKQINLKKCTFLVLDDAGRIAKNLRYLENILGQVRTDRQLIMWTVSYGSANNAQDAIKHTTKFGFDDYVRIDFGAYGQFHNPSAVKQLVDPAVDQADRDKRFIFLVQTLLAASSVTTKKPKILVFSSTPARMRKVSETLLQTGLLSKSFYSKPLPPAATATKEAGEKKDDAAATTTADQPAADGEAAKVEEKAEPEPEPAPEEEDEPVDDTPQYELNEAALHDNPLYHIWIANDNIPLEELDFGHFEFVINYDFPTELEAYEKRVLKYKAEGKGTMFSFILDSKQAKYVSAFMLESHQYVPPKMIDDKKNQGNANPNSQQNAGQQNKQSGQMPNRPPSLLQKNPMRNGGPFGGPRPGPYSGPPGRFGPGGNYGGGGGNFGPNRQGGFRNGPGPMGGGGGGGSGGGGGPMGRNFGGPGMMDALQLLNQLRNQGGNDSYGNNYRNSNFNSRNSGGGGGGGGGNGGNWYKEDGGRYNNNYNNRNAY